MKFNYEFSDLEKAKRVAANLSLPSDMEDVSRKNFLEGILLLFANWQNESFGDWNGDESCSKEGECEADNLATIIARPKRNRAYSRSSY